MDDCVLVLGNREFRTLKGYIVTETNRSLADIEKAEAHKAHAETMDTGQFSAAITKEVQDRAAAAADEIRKNNAKNALGFPEDDPKYGHR